MIPGQSIVAGLRAPTRYETVRPVLAQSGGRNWALSAINKIRRGDIIRGPRAFKPDREYKRRRSINGSVSTACIAASAR